MSKFPEEPVMEELTTKELLADPLAAITRVTTDHRRRMAFYNAKKFIVVCLLWGAIGVFVVGLVSILGWFS